ncbi:hypothetical protein SCBWM1_gp43 [Synechococcus phage S-CBWM1]|uniref:Uncharacterized protein n=1 Tax=Synechococcus phage S-CBWM1 TaxID=2053653 RepID=A0A3G1L3H4_9CAUD|nr:hypothetical protein HOU61_gp154 [Synechococcus phage S-CBWM1]ATW62727.1 hypothetical protein SCBWM1_gp43 [Synechococcus phage S-CBWM1]
MVNLNGIREGQIAICKDGTELTFVKKTVDDVYLFLFTYREGGRITFLRAYNVKGECTAKGEYGVNYSEFGDHKRIVKILPLGEERLTAPKVTIDQVTGLICSETYTVLPSGRTMICELTLRNGFTVTGKSAVVSINNSDYQIGKEISRKNAVDQIWQLEGYLLTEKIYKGEA